MNSIDAIHRALTRVPFFGDCFARCQRSELSRALGGGASADAGRSDIFQRSGSSKDISTSPSSQRSASWGRGSPPPSPFSHSDSRVHVDAEPDAPEPPAKLDNRAQLDRIGLALRRNIRLAEQTVS